MKGARRLAPLDASLDAAPPRPTALRRLHADRALFLQLAASKACLGSQVAYDVGLLCFGNGPFWGIVAYGLLVLVGNPVCFRLLWASIPFIH